MLQQDNQSGHAPAGMPLPPDEPLIGMSLLVAADLQDHLMVATNDLDRLQRLLDDSSQALMGHFTGATARLDAVIHGLSTSALVLDEDMSETVRDTRLVLSGAITAMQFQDMATQLIAHTSKRLRNCADTLARDTMGDDEDGVALVDDAPLRPNPVTQDEMDAGSIELF